MTFWSFKQCLLPHCKAPNRPITTTARTIKHIWRNLLVLEVEDDLRIFVEGKQQLRGKVGKRKKQKPSGWIRNMHEKGYELAGGNKPFFVP